MTLIGGRDAVEEFMACGMYLLLFGLGFNNVTNSATTVSKVMVPLPIFLMEPASTQSADHFLAKVETDVKQILGSYGPKEHDAFLDVKLPNGGRLNWMFEQMGVPYAPQPMSGTVAFTAAMKKLKVDALGKKAVKKAKVASVKKMGVIKIVRPKMRGTSKIESTLVKPIGVSKKFFLSNVSGPTLGQRDEGGPSMQMPGGLAMKEGACYTRDKIHKSWLLFTRYSRALASGENYYS
jgi:hypothetical protein